MTCSPLTLTRLPRQKRKPELPASRHIYTGNNPYALFQKQACVPLSQACFIYRFLQGFMRLSAIFTPRSTLPPGSWK